LSENGIEIRGLLAALDRLGARLEIEGEDILCHVSGTGLSPDLQEAVRRNKLPLLAHLRRVARHSLLPRLTFGEPRTQAPLSSTQRRIWFYERLHAASPFYSMPLALRVSGSLDVARLRAAWQHVVGRHPALTSIVVLGEPPVQRLRPGSAAPLELIDWEGHTAARDEDLLAQEVAIQARPLSADGDALAVAGLYRLAPRDHVLLITLHHLVADGWSMAIVVEDVFAAYEALGRGTAVSLAPLAASYFDYVRWHEAYSRSGAFALDLAFWRETLAGAPHGFDPLPAFSAGASPERVGPTHRRERRACDVRLHDAIGVWAAAHGGTVYAFLVTAWSALLHHWGAREDLVVGAVVAGRPAAEFDRVVGCFINILPLRVRIRPEFDFEAHHAEVMESLLAAYEHQHCPLESIVQSVNPERDTDSNPLFNTGLLLQNYPVPKALNGDLAFKVVPFERHGGSLDLRLVAGVVDGEFVLLLEYSTAWLDPGTARQLAQAYVSLLEALLVQPRMPLVHVLAALDWGELRVRQRVVVAANFTVEPLADAFEFWRRELDLPHAIRFAPYDQVMQSLLDPESLMRRHSDHNAVFLRLEEWLQDAGRVSAGALAAKTELFADACLAYQDRCFAPLTVWVCPPSRCALEAVESSTAIKEAQAQLNSRLAGASRIHLRWPESYTRKYSFGEFEDEYTARLGHIPYQQKAYTAFGTLLARELSAWVRPVVKAIVLDADNTLWSGVCAEDGAAGVLFDAAAIELQRFFLALRSQGVALCLCSKNVEADVRQVFELRAESPLRWSDFSARRVNWLPKSQNIREIAAELNIGLDAVVFVDDNPAECGEVEAHYPEVLSLQLPEAREEIVEFLHGVWELDVVQPAPDASLRLETYRLNAERAELQRHSSDLQDYLRRLAVQTTVRAMRAADFERASELTRRTSQFNFSGRYKSVAELAELCAQERVAAYVVEVEDRFGVYGLTGVVLCEVSAEVCAIETFVLSCRVLGKCVEREVMNQLEDAVRGRANAVRAEVVKTVRNQPAQDFAAVFFGAPAFVEGATLRYMKPLTNVVES
jgi:FkbH-like protein